MQAHTTQAHLPDTHSALAPSPSRQACQAAHLQPPRVVGGGGIEAQDGGAQGALGQ